MSAIQQSKGVQDAIREAEERRDAEPQPEPQTSEQAFAEIAAHLEKEAPAGPMPRQVTRHDQNGNGIRLDVRPSQGPLDYRKPAVKLPHTQPVDVVLVRWCIAKLVNGLILLNDWYLAARSLMYSWRRGIVSHDTYAARLSACQSCPHRYYDSETDDEYCGGARGGGGCGCGQTRVSRLRAKLKLSNWQCPLPGQEKRFGLGDDVKEYNHG